MTLKTALDDVRTRANAYKTSITLDEPQVRNEINWGVHDVCIRMLPSLDKWFITSVSITDGGRIPYNFVGARPKSVVVTSSGIELAPCKPDEFQFIQTSQINPPSTNYPKYTIQGGVGQTRVFNTLPTGLVCTMKYYVLPPELNRYGSDDAADLGVPDSLADAVILRALWGCLLKQQEKDKLPRVIDAYRKAMSSLDALNSQLKATRRIDERGRELPPLQEPPQ